MLMIIFGAGASFDSAQAYPSNREPLTDFRPPLADGLFGDRTAFQDAQKLFPQFKPIIAQLVNREGASVEQVLQRLDEESATYPKGQRQLAAVKYYLQWIMTQTVNSWDADIARGATCQLALVDQIQRVRGGKEPVCFVTFNYDMLLEKALDRNFDSISDYVTGTEFKLFKLHGSVNWGRRVTTQLSSLGTRDAHKIAEEIISKAASLEVIEKYEITRGTPPELMDLVPFYPAIALPIERKAKFECPEQHLNELRSLLPTVDRILTIGWRATEDHFLEMLGEHLSRDARIVACSGSKPRAEATLIKLRAARITASFESLSEGFSQVVSNPELLRGFLAGC